MKKTKRCPRCNEIKSAAEFYVRTSGGIRMLSGHCRKCSKEVARDSKRRISFGLSHEDYLAIAAAQDGKCRICKGELKLVGHVTGNTANVDHCHVSGRILSLLCSLCNTGLGSFKENHELLLAAAAYVKRTAKSPIK